MPAFPAFKTKPYYDALKTWLTTSLNEDGTLRDAAVADKVSAAIADNQTVVDAAAAAVDANPTIADHETRIETTETAADVLTALRFDPAHPTYGAVRGTGVSAAQRTANTAAINLAASDAATAGGTLVIKGEYETDATVTFSCHVDGAGGIISVYDTAINPAVLYGSLTSGTNVQNKTVMLPRIIQRGKSGTGWSGSDTGLVVSNVYHCHITIPHVRGFSLGTRFTAIGSGNVYNNVYLGLSENNKIGLQITTQDATGWCNESVWVGGRFQINSAEGANITGARHIQILRNSYTNNNHLFLKPSIEGDGPEYHFDSDGVYITVMHARWESDPRRVRLGPNANDHDFIGGYQVEGLTLTYEPGFGGTVRVRGRNGEMLYGGSSTGMLRMRNGSGADLPVISIVPANAAITASPVTAYSYQVSSRDLRMKRAADAHPRVRIDGDNGAISIDNGAQTPRYTLGYGVNIGMYVNTLFRVGAETSLPTATAGKRGYMVRIEGVAGVADGLYICEKDATDAYIWREI